MVRIITIVHSCIALAFLVPEARDFANETWGISADTHTVTLIVMISLGVLLLVVIGLCAYCVGSSILKRNPHRLQQQRERGNLYSTDSIIHQYRSRTTPPHPLHLQRAPAGRGGGYTIHNSQVGNISMTSSADDAYTERSSEELLPGPEQQQQQEEDPEYFILDKDYVERATLQIR